MSQVKDGVKASETLPQSGNDLVIALGSNKSSDVGSPAEILKKAISQMEDSGAILRAQSRFFQTPAVPSGSGPDFVNAAVLLSCGWSAPEAITRLHEIEADLGRRRKVRWEQRVVDLDLLAYGDAVRPNVATLRQWMDLPPDQQQKTAPGQLLLPHPRLHERAFVLVPMAEVVPNWVHPITRRTVIEMRDSLPQADLAAITPLE
ncbi:2-amino-4-hydroxy-6-hydroxymethyldihydropteridine diphosphokinase [Tateyamaria sp. syn59]|uniref:2-amino-4-hydroxy-6- hydroxymethyldihydropteridine diphosphokinase n=1 Tax=Tateyamaria sp. syn59 TaxID=2576942 RepID=UPI0011BD8298|nr:2-amino-4-hydroxy-6-hydroxymethyldihydropteridine diphosphokinase [Tateyamaria sp. syn59]